MNVRKRIEQLERITELKRMKKRVRFFDSLEEFEQEKKRNGIRENDICIIDDLEKWDE